MKHKAMQMEIYRYIVRCVKQQGYPPSVREICRALNIKSTATAHYYLDKLEERGVITRNANKNRAISLTDTPEFVSVPLVGTVTAGQPILAGNIAYRNIISRVMTK